MKELTEQQKELLKVAQLSTSELPKTHKELHKMIWDAYEAGTKAIQTQAKVICPLTKYLERQKEWSIKTFGNGKRTLGIIRHIEKELKEVEAKPNDLTEWIDVIILALDGYWRHGGNTEIIMNILQAKQDNNFTRVYPFPKSEDEPSEHIRGI